MGYTAWAASVVSVIISFYTDTLTQILLAMGAMLDALLVILGILFVWLLLQAAFKDLLTPSRKRSGPAGDDARGSSAAGTFFGGGWGRDGEEDAGWVPSWVSFMEFVTKILVILAFNYTAKLLLQEWLTIGVTVSETIVILLILVLFFFLVFNEVNQVVKAHQRRVIAETARAVVEETDRRKARQQQTKSGPDVARLPV